MKERLIRILQRWIRTLLSPSLEGAAWNFKRLQTSADTVARRAEVQGSQIQALLTAVLYERWQTQPCVIFSRTELGYWLNYHRLCGKGAEIGVHRGEFSELLLQTWQGKLLYSIDPWIEYSPDEYVDLCNVATHDQDDNYRCTVNWLSRFGARSTILKQASREASQGFEAGSLDFVYIDAQHHYEAVKEDIELWESKVKPGGIIAGHDYLEGQIESGLYGVKKAVDEWSAKRGYEVFLTREGPYPSWIVIKSV